MVDVGHSKISWSLSLCWGENLCLGLIHYTGFCGSEEILRHLNDKLKIYGLLMTDIDVFVTDCGADVQSAARILGIPAFPCLAHVINLIVKRFIFITCTLEDDDNVESDSEEHAIFDHDYNETIKVMRAAVRKIKLFQRKTNEATLDAGDLSGINWDKLLEIAQI